MFSSEFSLLGFALFMISGVFSTMLLPETRGRSLEDLSNEDQEGFIRPAPVTVSGRRTQGAGHAEHARVNLGSVL